MLVMVIALVAAGCGDDGDDDEAAGTTTTAESSSSTTAGSAGEGNELSVVAEDFSFSGAPEEIEAGVFDITFENVGQVEHELAFVEIGDTPIGEVGAALAPAVEGGPFPEFLENLTTPAVAEAGDTIETTALLAEGNYALICTFDGAVAEPGVTTTTAAEGAPPDDGPTGPPHYELGMIQPLTITASDAELVLPEAESTVTASDYAFDVDVKAGTQTVNFVNEGPAQVHHAVVFACNEGGDEAAADMALQTFLASQDPAAPPRPAASGDRPHRRDPRVRPVQHGVGGDLRGRVRGRPDLCGGLLHTGPHRRTSPRRRPRHEGDLHRRVGLAAPPPRCRWDHPHR
jgi:plastocyanin